MCTVLLLIQVYVDKTRYRNMLCYDWTVVEQARLTTDPAASRLWVVSMGQLNFNAFAGMRQRHRDGGGMRFVGFQPTGWSYSAANEKRGTAAAAAAARSGDSSRRQSSAHLKPRKKAADVIYSVPYSEHSSFDELMDFMRMCNPQRVVPTVNTSAAKVKEQLALLRGAISAVDDAVDDDSTVASAACDRVLTVRKSEFS